MLDFFGAIDLVSKLTAQIYNHVKMVKANPAQCQRLLERIQLLEAAIKPLRTLPASKQQQYELALDELVQTLTAALELVAKFSNKKTWFVEVMKAGTYHKKFEAITLDLGRAVNQLNLGLNAQQILNHQQDKQDQAKDQAALQAQQADILTYNQQLIEKTQQLRSDQQEGQAILLQQMASLKGKMITLLSKQAANSQSNINIEATKPPISSKYSVSFCDLLFDQKIGQGSFGAVYLGRWLEQPVAIKLIEGQLTDEQREEFIREVKIQSRLRSPRIVSFYAACLEPDRACLIMEYCAQNALSEVLTKQKLAIEQKQLIAHDIACGLYYLHQQGILHRDLKSSNVLVDSQSNAKLADFGLAKITAKNIQTSAKRSEAIAWQAPEVLKGQPHTSQSDIYSFAVILWELFTAQRPFANKDSFEITQSILSGKREIIPPEVPSEYAALIQQCWSEQPEERPDALTLARTIEKIVIRPPSPSAETYYQQGIEFERNKQFENAYHSYEHAKLKGYYKAYTNIGTFFLGGTGKVVPVDKAKAYEHFLVAAEQGHPRAMFNVGLMLEKGEGVTVNLEAALDWYKKTRYAYEKEGYPLDEIKKILVRISTLETQLSGVKVNETFNLSTL